MGAEKNEQIAFTRLFHFFVWFPNAAQAAGILGYLEFYSILAGESLVRHAIEEKEKKGTAVAHAHKRRRVPLFLHPISADTIVPILQLPLTA